MEYYDNSDLTVARESSIFWWNNKFHKYKVVLPTMYVKIKIE